MNNTTLLTKVLLYALLLLTSKMKAQSDAPNHKILGYWKSAKRIGNTYPPIMLTTYYHFHTDSIVRCFSICANKCDKYNSKYWFEGDSFYIHSLKGGKIFNRPLKWVNKDEFYLWQHHLHRITKEVYEQKLEAAQSYSNQQEPQQPVFPTTPPKKHSRLPFSCIICLDSGTITCGTCSGSGRVKHRVTRERYDYSSRKYVSYYDYNYSSCYNCHVGRVQCFAPTCQARK